MLDCVLPTRDGSPDSFLPFACGYSDFPEIVVVDALLPPVWKPLLGDLSSPQVQIISGLTEGCTSALGVRRPLLSYGGTPSQITRNCCRQTYQTGALLHTLLFAGKRDGIAERPVSTGYLVLRDPNGRVMRRAVCRLQVSREISRHRSKGCSAVAARSDDLLMLQLPSQVQQQFLRG